MEIVAFTLGAMGAAVGIPGIGLSIWRRWKQKYGARSAAPQPDSPAPAISSTAPE